MRCSAAGVGKFKAIGVLSPGACCGTMATFHTGSARRGAVVCSIIVILDLAEQRGAGTITLGTAVWTTPPLPA